MKKNTILIRIVSILITGIFLFQQVSWAAGDMSEIKGLGRNNFDHFKINGGLAEVDLSEFNGDNGTVINIQDDHSSLSAQYSIVDVISNLVNDYDIDIVAVEGGSGYIDTSILRSFPDKNIKEETASYLMKEGKLSAGEYYAVTTDKDIALYGAEDNELYQENLRSFRDIYDSNLVVRDKLKKALNKLKEEEDVAYSEDMAKFVYRSRLHRESKISFDIYWDYLADACQKYNINNDTHTNVLSFLDSVKLEKSIDFEKATIERKLLINDLMKVCSEIDLEELVIKTMYFTKEKIRQAEYHEWLVSFAVLKGADISLYPELNKFFKYTKLFKKINVARLDDEVSDIEGKLFNSIVSSEKEKELFRVTRVVELLISLFEIKLNRDDVGYLRSNLNEVDLSGWGIADVMPEARKALKFYEIAEKRDAAMLENTISAMKRENKKAAALITGGHHSGGLARLMKGKGLSYLVLMPKGSENTERPYVAVLTKKAGIYRDLVKSGSYDLALATYFDTGNIMDLEEMIAFAIGKSVFEGKNIKKETAWWSVSYRKAYNSIVAFRKKAMAEEPVHPDVFASVLDSLSVSYGVGRECYVAINGNRYHVSPEKARLSGESREKSHSNTDRKTRISLLKLLDRIKYVLMGVPVVAGLAAIKYDPNLLGAVLLVNTAMYIAVMIFQVLRISKQTGQPLVVTLFPYLYNLDGKVKDAFIGGRYLSYYVKAKMDVPVMGMMMSNLGLIIIKLMTLMPVILSPEFSKIGIIISVLFGVNSILTASFLGSKYAQTHDRKLIMTGAYKYLRHPMYFASAMTFTGTFIMFPGIISGVAVFSVLVFMLGSSTILQDIATWLTFGKKYEMYAAGVPTFKERLLPLILRPFTPIDVVRTLPNCLLQELYQRGMGDEAERVVNGLQESDMRAFPDITDSMVVNASKIAGILGKDIAKKISLERVKVAGEVIIYHVVRGVNLGSKTITLWDVRKQRKAWLGAKENMPSVGNNNPIREMKERFYDEIANEAVEFINENRGVANSLRRHINEATLHAFEVKRRLAKININSDILVWANRRVGIYHAWVMTRDGYVIDTKPLYGENQKTLYHLDDKHFKYFGDSIASWEGDGSERAYWNRMAAESEKKSGYGKEIFKVPSGESEKIKVNPAFLMERPSGIKVPFWKEDLYEIRNRRSGAPSEFRIIGSSGTWIPLYAPDSRQLIIIHKEEIEGKVIVKEDYFVFRFAPGEKRTIVDEQAARLGFGNERLLYYSSSIMDPLPVNVHDLQTREGYIDAAQLIGTLKASVAVARLLKHFGKILARDNQRWNAWRFDPVKSDTRNIWAYAEPIVFQGLSNFKPIFYKMHKEKAYVPDIVVFDSKGEKEMIIEIGSHSIMALARKYVNGIRAAISIDNDALGRTGQMPRQLTLFADEIYRKGFKKRMYSVDDEQFQKIGDELIAFAKVDFLPDMHSAKRMLLSAQEVINHLVESYERGRGKEPLPDQILFRIDSPFVFNTKEGKKAIPILLVFNKILISDEETEKGALGRSREKYVLDEEGILKLRDFGDLYSLLDNAHRVKVKVDKINAGIKKDRPKLTLGELAKGIVLGSVVGALFLGFSFGWSGIPIALAVSFAVSLPAWTIHEIGHFVGGDFSKQNVKNMIAGPIASAVLHCTSLLSATIFPLLIETFPNISAELFGVSISVILAIIASNSFVHMFADQKALFSDRQKDPFEAMLDEIYKDETDGEVLACDVRPVEAGLLHKAYVRYAMAVKEEVNPNDKPLKAVYGGAGCDVSNFLLATNARESIFVSAYGRLGSSELIKLMDKNYMENGYKRDIAPGYAKYKYNAGYAGVDSLKGHVDKYNVDNYAGLVEDLTPQMTVGALAFEIQAIGAKVVKVDLDGGHPRITLKWSYMGKEEKEYTITFVDANIKDTKKYPDILKNKVESGELDIYYQRAGMTIPYEYKRRNNNFVKYIYENMPEGSHFLTDDVSYTYKIRLMGLKNIYMDRGYMFPEVCNQRDVPGENYCAQEIEALRKEYFFNENPTSGWKNYGWKTRIRRKPVIASKEDVGKFLLNINEDVQHALKIASVQIGRDENGLLVERYQYPYNCLHAASVAKAILTRRFGKGLKNVQIVGQHYSNEAQAHFKHVWVRLELHDGSRYYLSFSDGQFHEGSGDDGKNINGVVFIDEDSLKLEAYMKACGLTGEIVEIDVNKYSSSARLGEFLGFIPREKYDHSGDSSTKTASGAGNNKRVEINETQGPDPGGSVAGNDRRETLKEKRVFVGDLPKDDLPVALVIPAEMYNSLPADIQWRFTDIQGVSRITTIGSDLTEEEKLIQLDRNSHGQRYINVLLDKDVFVCDSNGKLAYYDLENVIIELIDKARKDVAELLNPGLNDLTEEDIQASMSKLELKRVAEIFVGALPYSRSYKLSAKSIRQIRIETAVLDLDDQMQVADLGLRSGASSLKGTPGKYAARFIDGEDIVNNKGPMIIPPGIEIRRRRSEQGIINGEDIVHDKFFVVAPEKVGTEDQIRVFKEELMKLWLLDGLLDLDDIIVMPRKASEYSTWELFSELKNRFKSEVDVHNTGFIDLSGKLKYDKYASGDRLLQLTLYEKSSTNLYQYEALLSLLITDITFAVPGRLVKESARQYLFAPVMKPINLEREIRRYYDRYAREILTKA